MVRKLLGVLVVLTLVATGCGDDDEAAAESGVLRIEDAWARTSPMNADAGAVYMRITSPEADRLVKASAPASVARKTEIHETVMSGEGDAMAMQAVEFVELPAGEAVALEPGGYHVMLLDLNGQLELGEVFELTLTFLDAGEVTIAVEVRDEAP